MPTKKTTKPVNKGGRPKKEINQQTFEKLCFIQCTKFEICSVLDTTDKTLEEWCKTTYRMGFSEIFAIKKGNGKVSLRRIQFQLAQKNVSMAIWLGKQWLGQTDNPIPEDAESKNGLLTALNTLISAISK